MSCHTYLLYGCQGILISCLLRVHHYPAEPPSPQLLLSWFVQFPDSRHGSRLQTMRGLLLPPLPSMAKACKRVSVAWCVSTGERWGFT